MMYIEYYDEEGFRWDWQTPENMYYELEYLLSLLEKQLTQIT